ESRIHGFQLGADDYIPKPFSPHELVLRLRAVLRRRNTLMEVLVAGPLIVDPIALKVTLNGRSLDLSLLEFKLLSVLMCRAGDILSREELLRTVWGDDASVTKRVVDTNIYRLREKLKDSGDMMKTVRGLGYLFTIPERAL
ncbi:MAG: response regulator transcription factor, partial [Verrucomicrobia bacterium]|nr:response regulator transcription factor [Verrucomicrobiota bacterium]